MPTRMTNPRFRLAKQHEKKEDKVGNKTAYKKNSNGKKKTARKKSKWICKKSPNFWLMRKPKKEKKLLNYIQLAEI